MLVTLLASTSVYSQVNLRKIKENTQDNEKYRGKHGGGDIKVKRFSKPGGPVGPGEESNANVNPVKKRSFDNKSRKAATKSSGDINAKRHQQMKLTTEHNSHVAGTYTGRVSGNYLENKAKYTRKKDKELSQNSGDIDAKKYQQMKLTTEHNSHVAGTYTGRIPGNYLEKRAKSIRQKDKELSQNSGDIPADYLKHRATAMEEKNKQVSEYSGRIPGNYLEKKAKAIRQKDKEQSKYSGDLPGNYLENRKQARQAKNREVSSYSGDITVRSLQKKAKAIRKKSKKMANWKGDIVVHRMKKGMHPSAAYRGGKIRNSYTAKERYRRRVLKRYSKDRNIEVPNYQKRKEPKPKYDKREAEIWY